jgi:hypothetical protein
MSTGAIGTDHRAKDRRRRVCIAVQGAVVRALAESQGHEVVGFEEDGAVDLYVLDGVDIHPLQISAPKVPILVVSDRRLKDSDVDDLRRGGSAKVIDRDASILDLAFAFSDLLFETRAEQRRYARRLGGIGVHVKPSQGPELRGRLLGIARCGAILVAGEHLPDGTRIDMRFELARRSISLRGRIAFTAEQDREVHLGVEFALDDVEVAPRLSELMAESRSTSGLGAASVSM